MVVLRIIYIMFDSLKLQVTIFSLKVLFINTHLAYLRTWKLLQLFIFILVNGSVVD